MYKRAQYQIITERLKESRHFLQVVLGPRQVGKTTVIKQVVNDLKIPYQIYSADSIPATQTSWISDCWNTAIMQDFNRSSEETGERAALHPTSPINKGIQKLSEGLLPLVGKYLNKQFGYLFFIISPFQIN